MKKMTKIVLMLTMSLALLLLAACGGSKSSNSGTKAPEKKEEVSSKEDTKKPAATNTDFAKAVEGKLTLKMANATILINDKTIALPYSFEEIASAGVADVEHIRSVELNAGDFYSPNIFLDESEDYVIIPAYYNDGNEPISIEDAKANEIGMASYAEKPVDQNVSILGIKFGMTKTEVTDLLGEPSMTNGDYWEWTVDMEDSDYEGHFIIYFTSEADDAVVSQADLDITEY